MTPLLLLALTACGAQDDGPGVPSVNNGAKAKSDANVEDEITRYLEAQKKYVRCMEKEGFKSSDPDSKGRYEFEGDLGALKADPEFAKAQDTCKQYSLPVPAELERRNEPKPSAKEVEKRKRYSTCMQEQGAPDFPDVDSEGHSSEEMWNQNSSGAKRASRICEPILGNPSLPPGGARG
ncbi:hypothetical protein ACFWIA_16185 [Streptomyces sp. NPDC127068]|uniref:hypothetical protein n=1 Tax=Streptomyces sp. NPDC127068 TaxID=3347127 RepID=UPI00364AE3AB